MMVRTQISLDEEAHRRAKERAAGLRISFAEYVRQVLDRDLGEAEPRSDISAIFGMFNSGESDVSANIHRYVGEAVEAEYKRSLGRG